MPGTLGRFRLPRAVALDEVKQRTAKRDESEQKSSKDFLKDSSIGVFLSFFLL